MVPIALGLAMNACGLIDGSNHSQQVEDGNRHHGKGG